MQTLLAKRATRVLDVDDDLKMTLIVLSDDREVKHLSQILHVEPVSDHLVRITIDTIDF